MIIIKVIYNSDNKVLLLSFYSLVQLPTFSDWDKLVLKIIPTRVVVRRRSGA